MEQTRSTRLPLIILSGLLIALLAYLNWPTQQQDRQRGARVVSVKVAPAVMAEFSDEYQAMGTAKAKEDVIITARYSDVVKSVHFEDGDVVKKGQILVEFVKDEEQAKIKEFRANLNESMAQYKRLDELVKQKVASVAQRDEQKAKVSAIKAQLISAQAVLDNLTIRAPFDGQLGFREVSLGALVGNGDTITTLDDLSIIKVDFNIPERFITTVTVGQNIESTNIAFPEKQFIGKVTSVSTRVDAVTRTIQIRAEIENKNRKLRPGMLMSILLERNPEQILQVPESAVIPYEDKHFVFVVNDGVATKADVEIGRRKPGVVSIVSGLDEGAQVVVEGALKLRNGAAVSIVGENKQG